MYGTDTYHLLSLLISLEFNVVNQGGILNLPRKSWNYLEIFPFFNLEKKKKPCKNQGILKKNALKIGGNFEENPRKNNLEFLKNRKKPVFPNTVQVTI